MFAFPSTATLPATKSHEARGVYFTRNLDATQLHDKVYSNEGIAQLLFFESDEQCEISYKDKSGKYMHQPGLTLPKL